MKKISRREWLKITAVGAAGLGLSFLRQLSNLNRAIGQGNALNPEAYLPHVEKDSGPIPTNTQAPTSTSTATSTLQPGTTLTSTSTSSSTSTSTTQPGATQSPTPTSTSTTQPGTTPTSTPTPTRTTQPGPTHTPIAGSTVIHVHSEDATFWNGEPDYWNYVNQDVVTNMVNLAVMELTGTSSIHDGWSALLPAYQAGEKIAIKVSFNNSWDCGGGTAIDGIGEVLSPIVTGLETIGVQRSDIWVFDAIRSIPQRFVNKIPSGVTYFDNGSCRNQSTYDSPDPDAYITFSPPPGIPMPPSEKLPDVVVNADYLINIPIMKRHSFGVSHGFKNHFGTIWNPGGLHEYIDPGGGYYRTDYNPLVDLYLNPHLRNKTVLVLGDGIFASHIYAWPPGGWDTFGGNVPNSIFASTDPVAVDCVMHDFVAAEEPDLTPEANRYLELASQAELGIYEQGDPWGSGYQLINYYRFEI